MNYGLYLSASGVLTNMYRQDVYANNLANVQTVGFKRDLPTVRQRDAQAGSGTTGNGGDFRQALLDKIGGGALAGRQHVVLEQGVLQQTGNPLDAALTEPSNFFAVQTTNPRTGSPQVRLTRDGRFTLRGQGQLVTAIGGHPVLDANDHPITLQPNKTAQINASGQIWQGGQAVAQLQVASVSDPSRLVKEGQNLLATTGPGDLRRKIANPDVQAGHVEASTVDPIKTMVDLIEATQAITTNSNMIRYHDALMDKAVNVLGRVG